MYHSANWSVIPREFKHFCCMSDAKILKLVKTNKRSSLQDHPILVPLLCSIISCICPSITQAMHSYLYWNLSFRFRAAIARAILKKAGSDPDIFITCRHISYITLPSKILEKLVVKQLTTHLKRDNLSARLQGSLRIHHSTETAVDKIANDVLGSNDSRKVTTFAFPDLSTTFDSMTMKI